MAYLDAVNIEITIYFMYIYEFMKTQNYSYCGIENVMFNTQSISSWVNSPIFLIPCVAKWLFLTNELWAEIMHITHRCDPKKS